jgi:hypothetical protein
MIFTHLSTQKVYKHLELISVDRLSFNAVNVLWKVVPPAAMRLA